MTEEESGPYWDTIKADKRKMTTLREEIHNRLTFFSETKDKVEYDRCVKDILKLFEKLIDEKLDVYDGMELSPDLIQNERDFERIKTLQELKEELKK